jgi:glucose/arabinose dehydrogenase
LCVRRVAVLLLAGVAVACAGQQPPVTARTSPAPSVTATPVPATSPAIKDPGPLNASKSTLASGLEAPWAVAFADDGSIWLTERPGRVRVIRDGKLLPTPALTLSVVSQPGCEPGLMGMVIQGSYAYLDYTHSSPSGNVDRISRFTIDADRLTGEQVLLDGVPGGTCYHFGGRIKIGPDGLLYVTTGEGFVASRAADPNNLSGKILRMKTDGSGLERFAWGFRNPQGLAWDSSGRLYVSNNGPTGDLGLLHHDEIDYVQQGQFYGWPAWAGTLRTSYPKGSLPDRAPPLYESDNSTWAPSGITFYAAARDERPALFVAELSGQSVMRLVVNADDPGKVDRVDTVLSGEGRIRDVESGPDGCLYVLTTNRDGRGSPRGEDDRLLKLCPS